VNTRKKAKKKAGGKPDHMPIPHERFAHMLTALLGHIRGLDRERSIRTPGFAAHRIQRHEAGEILDQSTAREIADALYKLRALYREEWLRTLPNRREKARDLQDAVNAQALVDFFGIDRAGALEAIAGNPRVERDSAARTQRNRVKKARLLGVQPEFKTIFAAAKRTKKKTEE
jgi:hypothetical protein